MLYMGDMAFGMGIFNPALRGRLDLAVVNCQQM